MKLSSEEYRRGILSWNMDAKAEFRTSTATVAGEPSQWSAPLIDPNGSKVQSLPGRYTALSCHVEDLSALQRPFRVRWEHLDDQGITTKVWDDDLRQEPTRLRHVPNYGRFHRLVIATPYLAWAEDATIRVGDVVIRMVDGTVIGEQIAPLDQLKIEADKYSITGDFSGTAEAEGRFIEIVAPGASFQEAEVLAYTVLGFLALCLGNHAVGEVIFSEPYEASQGKQQGALRIPVTARIPREAEDAELDLIDGILPSLLGGDRSRRACALALRWYERGIRTTTPLDKLVSYFIGIEAIINAHAASHDSLLPEARAREERFGPVLERLAGDFDRNTLQQVRQRLVQTTLKERFGFYAIQHGWDNTLVDRFQELARLRNGAFHGDSVDIDEERAGGAKDLLRRLLKTELGLPAEMPWERIPQIGGLEVHYELVPHQQKATETTPPS